MSKLDNKCQVVVLQLHFLLIWFKTFEIFAIVVSTISLEYNCIPPHFEENPL